MIETQRDRERHYQVVRFFNDYIAGEVEEVVASDLTFAEADELFNHQRGQVPGEDIAIIDQEKQGEESEVKAFYSRRD